MGKQLPEKNNHKRRYMTGLDGLRALSVIAVVLYHMSVPWATGGFLGVTVFFVLSGYLITDILIADWKKEGSIDFKRFWIRRARRLLPAVYGMLFFVLAWVTIFNKTLLATLRDDLLAALFYFSNWWFIIQDVSYFENFEAPSLVTHFWSLAIEEQFYILWPIVMFVLLKASLSKKQLFWSLFGLALVSATWMAYLYVPGEDPSRIYYGTDTRAFSLLIGAALAVMWPSRQLSSKVSQNRKIGLDILGWVMLFIMIGSFYWIDEFDGFMYVGGMLVFSIVIALLIGVVAHPSSTLGKLLSGPVLRWVGLRSYGIYLWHYPILLITKNWLYGTDYFGWLPLIQIVLIGIFSELSWRLIEDPIRKGAIKRWMADVREKKWTVSSFFKRRWFSSVIMGLLSVVVITGIIIAPSYRHVDDSKVEAVQTVTLAEEPEETKEEEPVETVEQPEEKIEVDEEAVKEAVRQQHVTIIGDSVVIGATDALREIFPALTIDARIGRQMYSAPSVMDQLIAQGAVGQHVVITLGTNGRFNESDLQSTIEKVGTDRKIYLVNTRMPDSWQDRVNGMLRAIAEKYDHVTLIDWYTHSGPHPEFFEPDQTHLNREGAASYARLILRALEKRAVAEAIQEANA